MNIYCTYLTVYKGNKLPPFYIGSSITNKVINKSYHGSVSSKKYKTIWDEEIRQNPHLFSTKIISYHETNKEAREKELHLQKSLGVVNSPLYANMSEARVNGFFGIDVSGELNPRYGKEWGDKHPKGMLGKKHSEETKRNWSAKRKGVTSWNKGMKSPEHSEYMRDKMQGNAHAKGIKYPKCSCIICGKTLAINTLSRHYSSNH